MLEIRMLSYKRPNENNVECNVSCYVFEFCPKKRPNGKNAEGNVLCYDFKFCEINVQIKIT